MNASITIQRTSKVVPLDYHNEEILILGNTHVIGQTSAFLRSASSTVKLKAREALASTSMTLQHLYFFCDVFHHGPHPFLPLK